MKTNLFSILLIGHITSLLFFSCSNNKETTNIHTIIEYYEDTINQWGGGQGMPNDRIEFADRYISMLLKAYNEDPKHAKTPEYLDRVHMWYSTKGDAQNSAKWAEYVIEYFPKYENRQMLIESLATIYDNEIVPRDSTKVRYYYTQLLREFPSINKTDKISIRKRLKYNHLSLEEYIIQEINNKLDK